MRPHIQVVDLSSTFVGLGQVWDGTAFVEASLWTVRIADVPVNMSEAYPTQGPLRCYRMLQLGLDMPFGYLLATLSEKESAMLAAEDDPNRKLPELVYTMFVPLSKRIQRVNEARLVRMLVKVTPSDGSQHATTAPHVRRRRRRRASRRRTRGEVASLPSNLPLPAPLPLLCR